MSKHEVHCRHKVPISECHEHWIEFCDITGNTIERRALRWALGRSTGASSKTLCAFMLGMTESNGCRPNGYSMPPSDADDRRRCIDLLNLIPEWLPKLPQLAQANPGGTHDGTDVPIEASWAYQIPLILREGAF